TLFAAASSGPRIADSGTVIAEWDTVSSTLLRQFGKGPNGASDFSAARKLALSPDARLLALSRTEGGPQNPDTIHLVEVATGKEVRQLKGHTRMVTYACFSADGKMMASECWSEKTLRLWDVATGTEQHVIPLNLGSYAAELALSSDGKIVAVGGVA